MVITMKVKDEISKKFLNMLDSFKEDVEVLETKGLSKLDKLYLEFLIDKKHGNTKTTTAKELIKEIQDELHN